MGTKANTVARGSSLYEVTAASRAARIALAEDDDPFRQFLAAALRRDSFDVVEVRNGRELLETIASQILNADDAPAIDLIISDIRMPSMTGLSVLAGLRRADWAVPVILITAFGDEATHTEAKRLGARAVFDKPFNVDDLRTMALHLVQCPIRQDEREGPPSGRSRPT